MADIHWTNGTANNAWGTAGNWDPSGVPTSSDNVFIGGRSSDNITGAAQIAYPARCTFRNYSGSFGEAGNPITFYDATPTKIMAYLELKGSGQFYIDTDGVTITDVVVACSRRVAAQIVMEGVYTNLYPLMGSCTISGTVADIYQEYISNKRANTSLLISASAVPTNMRQLGGRSTLNKTLTGDLYLDDGAHCTYAVGDIDGTVFVGAGSRLVYNSKGGDLENVEVFNKGVLDFTQSQDPRSITTSCIVHAGGLIDAQGVDELIVITPTIKQIGAGADIRPANLGTRLVIQPSFKGPSGLA